MLYFVIFLSENYLTTTTLTESSTVLCLILHCPCGTFDVEDLFVKCGIVVSCGIFLSIFDILRGKNKSCSQCAGKPI